MANLINGNGNAAVYADQDADWFASIMGNQTSITGVGQQFEASILDAQTIGVADGVIITKEGRRIQLDGDQVDTFEIPVGEQGTTNYYIIGYHLYTTDDSSQVCDTFVQLMESSSATIQEDTFRGGSDEVYVSLYRVTQDGLTITDIDSLLPIITDLTETAAEITQINQHLTDVQSDVNALSSWTELTSATVSGTNNNPTFSADFSKYRFVYLRVYRNQYGFYNILLPITPNSTINMKYDFGTIYASLGIDNQSITVSSPSDCNAKSYKPFII